MIGESPEIIEVQKELKTKKTLQIIDLVLTFLSFCLLSVIMLNLVRVL